MVCKNQSFVKFLCLLLHISVKIILGWVRGDMCLILLLN